MTDDGAPKSAFELAMERLRKLDAEAGVTTKPLTEAQKAEIAEIRSLYDSKIAEQQILQESALKRVFDPGEREEVDRQFRREKERLASERDNRIEKIRRSQE
jgi:hypothetical protein